MPNKPLLLGITGGIGSGKSTVCHLFSVLGIPVYNADERAKWIVSNDPEIEKAIKAVFGADAFIEGKYNKALIASIVFKWPDKLIELNHIIHPAVGRDFECWVQANGQKAPYLVKEAALLFDSGSGNKLDYIAVVHAPDHLRIQRVKQRDPQRDEAQIKNIIGNQMRQQEMMERASFLIDNSGELMLIPQIIALNSSILLNI
ncbi:MAG: dephospho-CoA kinase [Cytophagaceae bacterium]|jgi:dephospho-CoA kinase|nr:dephospho-CoA kinase [Cytophagaceae bacterium]